MNHFKLSLSASVVALLSGIAVAVPTITSIGVLGSPWTSQSSRALAINADGTAVAGVNTTTSSNVLGVRWTSTWNSLEDHSCGGTPTAFNAISANGNIAVGTISNGSVNVAGRWDWPNFCTAQMPQPATSMGARASGINPAGTLIVGSTDAFSSMGPYSAPFKWTQSGGVAMLPFPGTFNFGYASAVSSNSQVIVGGTGQLGILSNPQSTYWDAAGAHVMGNMPSGIYSTATASNADGSVIVGYGDNGGAQFFSPGPFRAFRWTGGGYQNLGMLFNAPSTGTSFARSVTDDGSVVVGEATNAAPAQVAFIWRADFGMVELTDFLTWLGVDLTGWSRLTECNGISFDSTALCGTGIYNGVSTGFVVRGLPMICGPLIIAQTGNETVCAGDTAVLNVAVLTPGHSSYQWYQRFGGDDLFFVLPVSNGGNISGATSPSLIITNAQPGNSGQYFCTITGGCTSVNTAIVNLSVVSPPVVTLNPPLDVQPCGHGPQTLTIVATSNAGPIAYQWQAEIPFMSNNWVSLTNGLNTGIVTASGVTTPSVTLTDFNFAGSTVYRCRLTNSCGTSYPQATLVAPCFGDFNCDGNVDFFDYLDFVDSYSASGDTADFNHDGNVDFFDYLDFVDSYSAGC